MKNDMNTNNKKSFSIKQKLSLVLSLLLITLLSNISFAQSNADFQGTWTGVDKSGNTVELVLKDNMACTFKINGAPSYHISAYRLMNDNKTAYADLQSPKREIWFYTNNAVAGNTNSSVMQTVDNNFHYMSTANMTDATFKRFELSIVIDPNLPAQLFIFKK